MINYITIGVKSIASKFGLLHYVRITDHQNYCQQLNTSRLPIE